MAEAKIGLIGLAVMGENLALNIERNGYPIAVWNRNADKVNTLLETRAKGKKFIGCTSIEDFVKAIEKPRKIVLLVKAGEAVDWTVAQLKPYLEKGDIIIDGGNSWYHDTERRSR
ncbi:MAG: NAD(P)-binding domain-containing protein, partial [Blastocatellia bacterium]|nr:NAD(P)-binding domain-containing protein [Blastocatellia bacterium]